MQGEKNGAAAHTQFLRTLNAASVFDRCGAEKLLYFKQRFQTEDEDQQDKKKRTAVYLKGFTFNEAENQRQKSQLVDKQDRKPVDLDD